MPAATDQDLRSHLAGLARRLRRLAPRVRNGESDAAHQMRITARRARASLAVFGPALGLDDTVALRAELRWLTGVLGDFRDAEVMVSRLPTDHDVPDRVRHTLGEGLDGARARLLEALESDRFAALSPALDAAAARAREPGRKALTKALMASWRRTRRRHAAYLACSEDAERDERLHEVRKAARRLRYACEAVGPAAGAGIAGGAAAARRVQDVLGEHQDAVVSLSLLRGLAVAERDASRAASYAVLVEVETVARARAQERFARSWPKLEGRFSPGRGGGRR